MKTLSTKTIDSTTRLPLSTMTNVAEPAPSNDNAAPPAPDTTELVARPDVVHSLRGTLRRYGIQSQDMGDAVADVQVASIEVARAGHMPSGVAQWKALCAVVARRWAIHRLRQAEVRDKYDAGLCDTPEAYERPTLHWEERDPVDTKRNLAVLKGLFESGQMPPDGAEILWAEAEGVPRSETAAELGIAESTVALRLFRMRKRFRATLAALGMLVLRTIPRQASAPTAGRGSEQLGRGEQSVTQASRPNCHPSSGSRRREARVGVHEAVAGGHEAMQGVHRARRAVQRALLHVHEAGGCDARALRGRAEAHRAGREALHGVHERLLGVHEARIGAHKALHGMPEVRVGVREALLVVRKEGCVVHKETLRVNEAVLRRHGPLLGGQEAVRAGTKAGCVGAREVHARRDPVCARGRDLHARRDGLCARRGEHPRTARCASCTGKRAFYAGS